MTSTQRLIDRIERDSAQRSNDAAFRVEQNLDRLAERAADGDVLARVALDGFARTLDTHHDALPVIDGDFYEVQQ